MNQKEIRDESGMPSLGTSPRRASGLFFVLAVLVGIIIAVAGIIRFAGSPKNAEKQAVTSGEAEHESDSAPPATTVSGPLQGPSAAQPLDGSQETLGANEQSTITPAQDTSLTTPANTRQGTDVTAGVPSPKTTPDTNSAQLEDMVIPPKPYSILYGTYKTLQEAQTTVRELHSHYLPAYVSPVDVQGNLARSLFSVSEDGLWYRVLIGSYSSKEEARDTLGTLMETGTDTSPAEIMKFSYALECGRFVDSGRAANLMERIEKDGLLPYEQTCPAGDGRTLRRILVGCFFSSMGAQSAQKQAAERGYRCGIVER